MRLTPRARAILGIALAPMLLGGLLVPASASARPGGPELSTVASDPVGAILGQYPPNESPSGAGERYLLERARLCRPAGQGFDHPQTTGRRAVRSQCARGPDLRR